jgi:hypothetical protein
VQEEIVWREETRRTQEEESPVLPPPQESPLEKAPQNSPKKRGRRGRGRKWKIYDIMLVDWNKSDNPSFVLR